MILTTSKSEPSNNYGAHGQAKRRQNLSHPSKPTNQVYSLTLTENVPSGRPFASI